MGVGWAQACRGEGEEGLAEKVALTDSVSLFNSHKSQGCRYDYHHPHEGQEIKPQG